MAKHKDPAERKHFWEYPAPEPEPVSSASDYPQHVHKLDGSWKEVADAAAYEAAIADGWIPASRLNYAKQVAAAE